MARDLQLNRKQAKRTSKNICTLHRDTHVSILRNHASTRRRKGIVVRDIRNPRICTGALRHTRGRNHSTIARGRWYLPCHLWVLLIVLVLSAQGLNSKLQLRLNWSLHHIVVVILLKQYRNKKQNGDETARFYFCSPEIYLISSIPTKPCKRWTEQDGDTLFGNFLYKISSSRFASSGNRFRHSADDCFLPIYSNLQE